jgi:hypothetical protein
LTAAGTAFLSAAAFLVHSCPRYALGFFLGRATRFIAFGDVIRFVIRFAFCFRCISICRREASPLSRPPNCMLNPSEPLEGRNGQGEG